MNSQNIQKILGFIKKNSVFYLVGFLILLGMKYYYSRADAESLRWILGPTAGWVELLSGIPFRYEPGLGYANHSLRYLIAPSCSGVQFLIITAAMLIFTFVHEAADVCLFRFLSPRKASRTLDYSCGRLSSRLDVQCRNFPDFRHIRLCRSRKPGNASHGDARKALARTGAGLCWIVASLLLSYGFTVFVNGLRIIAAIYLPSFFERLHVFHGFGRFGKLLTADRLHTVIGVVVYFTALLTVHQLVSLFFRKDYRRDNRQKLSPLLRRCLSPLFWYFLIVLGIPFLHNLCQNRTYQNKAYQKGGSLLRIFNSQFRDFALLVMFCCGFILLLYGLASLVYTKWKGRH